MSAGWYCTSEVPEGQDFGYTLGQIAGPDGVLLVQSDVSTIDLTVYDITTGTPGTAVVTLTGLSPSTAPAIIQNSGTLANGWVEDAIGYNLAHYLKLSQVGASNVQGGHVYRLEYTVHTDAFDGSAGNWGDLVGVRDVTVRSSMSS